MEAIIPVPPEQQFSSLTLLQANEGQDHSTPKQYFFNFIRGSSRRACARSSLYQNSMGRAYSADGTGHACDRAVATEGNGFDL
jgi:hypothetical protein